MVRVHVLIGYLVAGGVSDGVFFGHVCLFSRYMRFFVRFLSRFSSRHPSVLVLGRIGVMASRGRMQARSRVQLVEGRIRWAFRSLPKVRCLAAILHSGFPSCCEWRINSEVSFICLLLTGDCSRNSKSYRWYLESRQGFENRGISNAVKIERPHSRSE